MSGGTGIATQEHAPPCGVPVANGAGSARHSDGLDLGMLAGAVPRARQITRAKLADWHVDPDVAATVELVVSELVTNALQASAGLTAAEILGVGLRVVDRGPRILIEVNDSAPVSPAIQQPDDDALHGRGLVLVAAFAEDWGWYPLSGARKVVWAKVAK